MAGSVLVGTGAARYAPDLRLKGAGVGIAAVAIIVALNVTGLGGPAAVAGVFAAGAATGGATGYAAFRYNEHDRKVARTAQRRASRAARRQQGTERKVEQEAPVRHLAPLSVEASKARERQGYLDALARAGGTREPARRFPLAGRRQQPPVTPGHRPYTPRPGGDQHTL